ncbi:MAG: hypothetical protein OEL54_05800, partial [Flavobacteriaceae bacterium]|nr:hypothetical protein [Flavobacteriaceae bacterium]
EVEVKVNDKIIKATLADNNKQLQLDAKEIFKLANNAKKIKLSIKAKGEKGTTLINQEIPLSYPPEGPIKLEVGNKNKNIFTNKLIDIKVKTDRNIASYEIFIDNKKIDLELKKDDEKKPTQEKTPKNQITIKKGFLKNLKEGNNAFKIVVKDLFDKTAEQIITINLDKTTPNLVALQINPLGRDNDTTSDSKNKPVDNKTTKNSASLNQKAFPQQKVNEGDDLKTFWSEPINSLEISQAEKKQKIVFEKEQKEVIIKSDQIKNMFLNKNKGVLKLTYIDQAGNKNQTDLKILFIKKPTGAPKISFNSGKDSLTTNPSKIISIKSNRLIKKWIIFIDDKELKILPNDKTAVVQDSLKIKPEFFSNITEGQHKLKVTAIDEFELKADKILILNFDTSTPKIINSAIPINFKKLEFEKGKSITVNLSESVEKLETLINNSPWGLKLGTDKKSFTIKSNGKIKETAQNYSVIFYDLAGNKNGIIGSISFKSERDKILLQNYNKSILTKTGSLKDKMMLVNRPEFMLNTTDPIDLVPRKKKKKIKKKLNFLTKITDPFLYQLKLE